MKGELTHRKRIAEAANCRFFISPSRMVNGIGTGGYCAANRRCSCLAQARSTIDYMRPEQPKPRVKRGAFK